jgi:hypothetical protein
MTDAEMRAACLQFFADMRVWPIEHVNQDSKAFSAVLTFADGMWAQGLREAAAEARSKGRARPHTLSGAEVFACELEQKAKEREGWQG